MQGSFLFRRRFELLILNPERHVRNETGAFRPELGRIFRIWPEFKPGQKRRRFVPDFEVKRAVPAIPAGTERNW